MPGGKLFSKLHKLRNEKAKEHPECFSSGQHKIKLKTSYTSPTISTECQHANKESMGIIREKLSDESPDTDFPTSWDETQRRLESCGTHSYIEETGCLQNTRSAVSFYTKLDRLTLHSGPTRMQVNTRIHPPAPSLCLHSSETQEKPALPLSCARVSQALGVMSEHHKQIAGMGLIECSSEFEEAWKAADSTHNCEKINPYAVTDSNLHCTVEQTAPQTNQTSCVKAASPNSENNGHPRSSSPAILHLSLHCQTQIHRNASWDTNGCHQGSVLSGSSVDVVTSSKPDIISPTTEERNGVVVIRSTDTAVFSDRTDKRITSEISLPSSASICRNTEGKQGASSRVPASLTGLKYKGETKDSLGEPFKSAKTPCEKTAPAKEGSFLGWLSSGPSRAPPHRKNEDADGFLNSDESEGPGEDQFIEVDGWCHIPEFPLKSSRPTDKVMQTCWGLPEAEVRVWAAQILLALESLHQQGILCRDLNPRNVLLTSNGESGNQLKKKTLHEKKHNSFDCD